MIIPIYKSYVFKKDDIIVSIKSIFTEYCVFTQNHEFTIKHIKTSSEIYNIIVDNEQGIEIKIQELNNFSLKCDLETAQKRSIYLNDKNYIKKFILKNCPNKDYSYDRYDKYDSCKLKCCGSDACSVDINICINYIPREIIEKDDKITTILRSKKINKIKNVL